MNIYKRLVLILAGTIIALIYINQKALIYQMGLRLRYNQDLYAKMVDHNKLLVYNVLNLKAPAHLESRLLANNISLGMPKRWHIMRLTGLKRKEGLANLLGLRELEVDQYAYKNFSSH